MLLRSSSTPILNSWLPVAPKDALPDHHPAVAELHPHCPQISRARSLSVSISSPSSSPTPSPRRVLTRALSESDLSDPSDPEGIEEKSESLARLLSSSGLDGLLVEHADERCVAYSKGTEYGLTLLVGGGGCVDGGGGRGGGGDGGDKWDAEFGFSDSNRGTEEYYLKMIEADPSNSLVLGNYAKFLKEVQGDLVKSQEYCERAILVNPGDAHVLSLYADLIWQTSKDVLRAETYFDRAVQAAPQDCYVMASYAHFLWDAEEEEEKEYHGEEEGSNFTAPPFLQGAATPSVAAAS